MGNAITDKLRLAAEGLVLADAQKHILAHRLARKLAATPSGDITVDKLLKLIDQSMWDMRSGVEVVEVSDDAYRDNAMMQSA